MLKRHLMIHYQMTLDRYRQRWDLPADYPIVALKYAEQRRTVAKSIGLGTKPRKTTTAEVKQARIRSLRGKRSGGRIASPVRIGRTDALTL